MEELLIANVRCVWQVVRCIFISKRLVACDELRVRKEK
jgi:hypothetical protein